MKTIPFKKTAFSETPYKRDFKKFAEEVFKAYSHTQLQKLECASNLIKHSDNIKYCDDKYITYIRKYTFSFNAYARITCKSQTLGELTKFELNAKSLYWVENKSDAGKYTFQDLIDVIDEYRELK